jgi:rfaE bifunctional protein nucleotidyltransferase chain/domain
MRAAGRRLVLTNGCFDLLHIGHVRYLEQARTLGDALAVAVNSDASVQRLKAPGRPINPADERAEVVAALESVDFVVIFDEDTAESLVAEVQPAFYVKGGDYSEEPESDLYPPEGRVATEHGGEVRVLEYVPNRSTSATLRRIDDL